MDPLILHIDGFWTSPYAFSVFVALTEKGLPFEIREVNLHEHAQKTAAFRTLSVTARVPVLEHGSFHLSESSAIVEYLDDAFPAPRYPSLMPSGIMERARARQIMAWIRSDLMPLREERPTSTIFYESTVEPLSVEGRLAADKLIAAASAFIPDERTTLFDTFSVADVDLATMLQRLIANGEDAPPKLRAFVSAQWQRPSVRAFVEHARRSHVPY